MFAKEALKQRYEYDYIFGNLENDNPQNVKISSEGINDYISWAKSPARNIERFFSWLFGWDSLSQDIKPNFIEKIPLARAEKTSSLKEQQAYKKIIEQTSNKKESLYQSFANDENNIQSEKSPNLVDRTQSRTVEIKAVTPKVLELPVQRKLDYDIEVDEIFDSLPEASATMSETEDVDFDNLPDPSDVKKIDDTEEEDVFEGLPSPTH